LGGLTKILISGNKNKKALIENYFNAINNEKISKMNLANQEIVEAMKMIKDIFRFLKPY